MNEVNLSVIRELLASFTGKNPDEVNPIADLTAMFETVVNQSDELGMIDYNGYKAKLSEANEKAQWWENEARQSGRLMLMEQREVVRLRAELATVAEGERRAIEALRKLESKSEYVDRWVNCVAIVFDTEVPEDVFGCVRAYDERGDE